MKARKGILLYITGVTILGIIAIIIPVFIISLFTDKF